MKRHSSNIVIGAGLLGLFLGFRFWQSPASRLTRSEIDCYLAAIDLQLPLPTEEKKDLLDRLHAWAEADDGKPVCMLNLMRFHERPDLTYPGAPPDFAGSAIEANAYYEANVLHLALGMGAYPLVSGMTQGRNLIPVEPALDDWSRVIMMRYPSRRAFLQLLADPAYAPLEPYKMMSLKIALVPVSGDLVVPNMTLAVGSTLIVLFLTAGWIGATLAGSE